MELEKLVMELSNKISNLDSKISSLEEKIDKFTNAESNDRKIVKNLANAPRIFEEYLKNLNDFKLKKENKE